MHGNTTGDFHFHAMDLTSQFVISRCLTWCPSTPLSSLHWWASRKQACIQKKSRTEFRPANPTHRNISISLT